MDLPTQGQLERLHARLLALREGLRGELQAAGRQAPRDRADTRDRKDIAADASGSQLDEIRELRELSELDAVEAALRRIEAGSYGDCCECGEPIGLPRLQSMPMATRCAACQQRLEDNIALGRGALPAGRPVHYG